LRRRRTAKTERDRRPREPRRTAKTERERRPREPRRTAKTERDRRPREPRRPKNVNLRYSQNLCFARQDRVSELKLVN